MLLVRLDWKLVDPPSLLDDAEEHLKERELGERRPRADDDELRLGAREANVDTAPVLEEVADLQAPH